jgi:hypothetical protein
MKQYEYKELSEFIDVESDYKCGSWKFRDDVIKILNEWGKEGWRPAAELDNLEQTIYYDSDARKCTAELSGIFFREIEEEDNITLNKK